MLYKLAAGLGFEPRFIGPEPIVLPLHYPAIKIQYTTFQHSQECWNVIFDKNKYFKTLNKFLLQLILGVTEESGHKIILAGQK